MNYKIIKSNKQYDEYCVLFMQLDTKKGKLSKEEKDVLELLELLIDKWEAEHFKKHSMDPIQLLKHLMENHEISRSNLVDLLGIQKSAISQILSYKKGLSKEVIRKLSDKFHLSQEVFNRAYPLILAVNQGHKNERMMNTPKKIKLVKV